MFGWELPPYNSGGLGTACQGLTKALAGLDLQIDFVLPKTFEDSVYPWMSVIDASAHATTQMDDFCSKLAREFKCVLLNGYYIPGNDEKLNPICRACVKGYGNTPFSHVNFYTAQARTIAASRDFDVIHAHDWFTYPAAMEAKKVAHQRGDHVPMVLHVHATQVDRAGGNTDSDDIIYQIEKAGFDAADELIAVSSYTKRLIAKYYGIDPKKISVVHNGIDHREPTIHSCHPLSERNKLVLYLGRITLQKGPDYFIKVAKLVTDAVADVKFVMLGSGDMETRMMEEAADMGLTTKIIFNSFIKHSDMDRAYQMSDVFILPSVSEPFGITPLEAIQNGVPVVISNTSGVAEVVENVVKVDFWDVERTAREIIDLLNDPERAKNMSVRAKEEIKALTWEHAAQKTKKAYKKVLRKVGSHA